MTARAIDGSAPVRLRARRHERSHERLGTRRCRSRSCTCGIEQVFDGPAGKIKQNNEKHTWHVVGGGENEAP